MRIERVCPHLLVFEFDCDLALGADSPAPHPERDGEFITVRGGIGLPANVDAAARRIYNNGESAAAVASGPYDKPKRVFGDKQGRLQ